MARTIDALVRALGDTNDYVRWSAAVELGNIVVPAIEPLCKALGDMNDSVRLYAAEALGKLGDTRAVEPLCKALGDTDYAVRWHAAEALGEIGNDKVLPSKILLSSSMDLRERVSALNALSSTGKYYKDGRFHKYKTPDARQYCQKMTEMADPHIRKAAKDMLRYLDNDLGVPASRDEPKEREELLRGAFPQESNETGETLLRGSEKSTSPEPRKPPWWRRLIP